MSCLYPSVTVVVICFSSTLGLHLIHLLPHPILVFYYFTCHFPYLHYCHCSYLKCLLSKNLYSLTRFDGRIFSRRLNRSENKRVSKTQYKARSLLRHRTDCTCSQCKSRYPRLLLLILLTDSKDTSKLFKNC